ncbi:MAG TPA: hypothetical protein VGK49_04705, partial [Ilumatobacteraceae bacterium]
IQLAAQYIDMAQGSVARVDIDPGAGTTFVTNFTFANHGFSPGTRVREVGSGLTVYFVIVVNGNTFRLSSTAGGAAIDFNLTTAAGFRLIGNTLEVSAPATPGLHSFERGIQGLQSGVTYYVDVLAGNDGLNFQLLDGNGAVVQFDAGFTPTAIRLGNLGLDLRQGLAATGSRFDRLHTIHVDLTTDYTRPTGQALGTHTFGAPGGSGFSLSTANPPTGDGKSGASSFGGSGGLGAGSEIHAHMTSTPTVTAYIAATNVTTAGSIVIVADSDTNLSSSANTGSGGGVQVGLTRASTIIDQANTTAYVGGSTVLDAGRNVVVSTDSNHFVNSVARSTGGGAISANDAETSAKITFANETYIAEGASITAGDAVGIYAKSTARGTNDVYSESWGVGAGADSDNTHDTDDAGVHIVGTTRTRIGEGVTITAQSVDIDATAESLTGRSDAYAKAINPILFGVAVAFADAVVKINSNVQNLIGVNLVGAASGALTVITGYRGIDITASNPDIVTDANADVLAVAFIPPQDADEIEEAISDELVDVDANVRIVVGARSEARAGRDIGCPEAPAPCSNGNGTGLQRGSALAEYDKALDPALALYVDVKSGEDDTNDVRWDADVLVLGGRHGSPLLVVDADGVIQALNNLKVWADAGKTQPLGLGDNVGADYFVLVENDGYADIFFGAESNVLNESRTGGSPRWPIFIFRDNLESVTIIDHADSDMHLLGVDVINRTGRDPMVQITSAQGADNFDERFGFDLRHSISPYLITVDIQKLGTATDIVLDGAVANHDGAVVNPTGWTRILNEEGDIRSNATTAR